MSCNEQFRQMPFRFLGYGMTIGQSIRYLMPNTTGVCNMISQMFMSSHVICVLTKESQSGNEALKVLAWEVIATVTPAVIVHIATSITWSLIFDMNLYNEVTEYIPCLLGLALCVGLQQPLDKFADDMVAKMWP